jgi:hypothetical protein
MGIVVKHSGNAAPVLYGAYGGGQGKRRAEDARQAADHIARATEAGRQRAFAHQQAIKQFRRQQILNKQARKHEDARLAADRKWREEQAAAERDFRAHEAGLQRDWQQQHMLDQHDLNMERGEAEFNFRDQLADNEQQRRRDDIEWGYTAKQRQDFDRMFDALEEARESGDFTGEEMGELTRQAYAKLAGLQPVPRLKEKSPYPEGQQPGQVWESDDGTMLLSRDDKGNVRKVGETNRKPTFNDRNAAWKMALEMAEEPVLDSRGEPSESGKTRVNIKRARQYVREILRNEDDAQAYGGANPEAVRRWGVGQNSATDFGLDEEDGADDESRKRSAAERWAI